MKKILLQVAVLIVALILINYGSGKIYKRLDLTKDSRYTLSPEAIDLIKNVDGSISIDVFLDGDLPGEFRKLRQETKQLLEEMVAINPNIKFDFINPLEGYSAEESDQVIKNLMGYGIKPALASVQQAGKNVNVTVFPYAIILHNDKTVPVPLLKTVARSTAEERVNSSIQQLEFQFADGLRKATIEKTKTIAVMRDSGQLNDKEIADFIMSLQ
ncbi:MAG: Gldg family protein, partial [Nonlabens sp.]|nr:Gldg family protein [Nonlabens sp.]